MVMRIKRLEQALTVLRGPLAKQVKAELRVLRVIQGVLGCLKK